MVTFHFEGDFFGQFGPELRGRLGLFGAVWLRIFPQKKRMMDAAMCTSCLGLLAFLDSLNFNRSKNPCFDHAYQPELFFFSQSLASSV